MNTTVHDTIIAPTILGDILDRTSFLVPCLAFTDAEDAALYAAHRAFMNDQNPTNQHDVYESVIVGSKVYVPRISRSNGRWHADELLTGKGTLEETRWEKLRSASIPMPSSSAFNVCLLVSGPRKYSPRLPPLRRTSQLWFRLNNVDRDCFVAWGRASGLPFGGRNIPNGENHLIASNHGRGVIFARSALFSGDGTPKGITTHMLKVEFSVRDSDPAKDDMVKVKILRHLANTRENEAPYSWATEEKDPNWKPIVERAEQGFDQFCRPVPKETDNWRRFFIDQRNHLDDDKLARDGSSYREQVKALGFQEAMENVFMPWHLQVVIEVHCGHGEFEDSPHRNGTTSTRVRNMLAAYVCSDGRRKQLQAMISHFVEPNNDNWNWSGD